MDAISTLLRNVTDFNAAPSTSLPQLNVTLPDAATLQAQFQQFLTRAANDPDIVNYYNQLLQQAQGDANIAIGFLQNDYSQGVRNVQQNLTATMQQLGLTSQQENQSLQDQLNQRGIGVTQAQPGQNSPLAYAGGGQAASELGNLRANQALRDEAQQRSAQQNLTGLQSGLQKGLTSTGQQLAQQTQSINQQKQSDIFGRAQTYYGMQQAGQQGNQIGQFNKQIQAANMPLQGLVMPVNYGGASNYPTLPRTV